tara:strand:+ start:230 stop:1324 length:1095 start_codon:yes stop_codon:yes gene_type:complete
MKKEYQTNIEDLLEKIRVNTSETEINTDSLALDVTVDGLETLQGATNTLLTSILAAQNASLSGDEQQVDIVSGAVVATLSAVDNAVLDAMVVDLAAIEALLILANVDHAANEVLLGTIDSDTDAIKTSAAALVVDAAANEVLLTSILAKNTEIETTNNANQVLLGTIDEDTNAIKVDLAALEVLSTAANVDHAANEVLLTGIDADTDAIKTDIAALEVLSTAANVDLAAMEVDLAALEVLSTAANVDLAAIEVDLAALEVLSTAANVDHAANEVLLTAIKANQLLMLGNSGSVTISGNGAQTPGAGVYCAVYFIGATTPTTLTIGSSTTVADVVYPAGTWLYGDIEAITGDASALYTLYKGNPA